jgi:hypothetical protein
MVPQGTLGKRPVWVVHRDGRHTVYLPNISKAASGMPQSSDNAQVHRFANNAEAAQWVQGGGKNFFGVGGLFRKAAGQQGPVAARVIRQPPLQVAKPVPVAKPLPVAKEVLPVAARPAPLPVAKPIRVAEKTPQSPTTVQNYPRPQVPMDRLLGPSNRLDRHPEDALTSPELHEAVSRGDFEGAKKYLEACGDPLAHLIDPKSVSKEQVLPQKAPDTVAAYGVGTNRSASLHYKGDGKLALMLRDATKPGAKPTTFVFTGKGVDNKTLVAILRHHHPVAKKSLPEEPVKLARFRFRHVSDDALGITRPEVVAARKQRADRLKVLTHPEFMAVAADPNSSFAAADWLGEHDEGNPLRPVLARADRFRHYAPRREDRTTGTNTKNEREETITGTGSGSNEVGSRFLTVTYHPRAWRGKQTLPVVGIHVKEHAPMMGINKVASHYAPVTRDELNAIRAHYASEYDRHDYSFTDEPTKLARNPNVLNSFADAIRDTLSQRQIVRRRLASRIAQEAGLDLSALHDVAAINPRPRASVVQVYNHQGEPEAIRYAAAWYALLAREPRMTVFHEDPNGPDFLHVWKTPLGTDQVLGAASRIGLPGVAVGIDGSVHVHNPGGQYGKQVEMLQQVTRAADLGHHRGTGHRIGTGSGDAKDARQAYRDVIRQYEAGQGTAGGEGAGQAAPG